LAGDFPTTAAGFKSRALWNIFGAITRPREGAVIQLSDEAQTTAGTRSHSHLGGNEIFGAANNKFWEHLLMLLYSTIS